MPSHAEIEHLLRRTEFVARRSRVRELESKSWPDVVDDVLDVPHSAVEIPASLSTHVRLGNFEQYRTAVHWWFQRMATDSPRPLQEKMALFWHGHFCTNWDVVHDTPAMMTQNQLWRSAGLGNLKTLIRTMSVQTAMLRYLDNGKNRRSSPNQNFARELLELFTLGPGNYTESDVEAAAAAWTGHNLGRATGAYQFDPAEHDDSRKVFLGRAGKWNGFDIIEMLFDARTEIAVGEHAGLSAPTVMARFLSRKLWEAFCSEDPSDGIVAALAEQLIAANFEIKPWLRAMLLHPEFHLPATRRGLVRSPAEYVAAVLYHADVDAATAHPEWYCPDMGQALFLPPDVNGWGVNRYWLTETAATGRAAFADSVRRRLTRGRPEGELRLRGGSWTWNDLDSMTPERLVTTIASGLELQLTSTTRNAVSAWAAGEFNWRSPDWWRTSNTLFLLMLSPEMSVA